MCDAEQKLQALIASIHREIDIWTHDLGRDSKASAAARGFERTVAEFEKDTPAAELPSACESCLQRLEQTRQEVDAAKAGMAAMTADYIAVRDKLTAIEKDRDEYKVLYDAAAAKSNAREFILGELRAALGFCPVDELPRLLQNLKKDRDVQQARARSYTQAWQQVRNVLDMVK